MILMATFLDFLHDFVGQLILQLSSGVLMRTMLINYIADRNCSPSGFYFNRIRKFSTATFDFIH